MTLLGECLYGTGSRFASPPRLRSWGFWGFWFRALGLDSFKRVGFQGIGVLRCRVRMFRMLRASRLHSRKNRVLGLGLIGESRPCLMRGTALLKVGGKRFMISGAFRNIRHACPLLPPPHISSFA